MRRSVRWKARSNGCCRRSVRSTAAGAKGLKTPESAYLRPILDIQVEQGGSGDANMVLDLLYAKLAPVLNDSHSIRSCLHPL